MKIPRSKILSAALLATASLRAMAAPTDYLKHVYGGAIEYQDAVGMEPLNDKFSLLGRVGVAHVKLDTSNGDGRGTGRKPGVWRAVPVNAQRRLARGMEALSGTSLQPKTRHRPAHGRCESVVVRIASFRIGDQAGVIGSPTSETPFPISLIFKRH